MENRIFFLVIILLVIFLMLTDKGQAWLRRYAGVYIESDSQTKKSSGNTQIDTNTKDMKKWDSKDTKPFVPVA